MPDDTARSEEPNRVVLLDADPDVAERLSATLAETARSFEVLHETDPRNVRSLLNTSGIDCVVSEYDLPGMDGIELLEAVRETDADLPFVLFTASGDEAIASRAISSGVTDYVRYDAEGDGVDALADRIRAVVGDPDSARDVRDDDRFERFVEAFPDVVFVMDDEGRYTDVIASGNGSLLYDEPGELLGERFHDVLPEETADRFLDAVHDALASGEQQRIEYQLDVRAGTRWFEARVGPLRSGQQETVYWIARDVTERKRHEREYEQIFNNVNDAIAVFDPATGEILDVNDTYHEMIGYDDLETIRELGIEGLSVSEEGYTGDRGSQLISEVADTGEPRTVEWRGERKDGTRLWLEATLAPAQIGGEQRVLSIQRDVTERRELERSYRNIFENVSDGLVIHDPATGEILEVNEQFCEMNGYDRTELVGEDIGFVTAEEYSYAAAREMIEMAREGGAQLFEWRNRRKDGETYPVEVHLSVVRLHGEERVLASVRDISERKEREREYEQIFDGVNDIIAVRDPETGEIVDANQTYADLLGYDREEMRGTNVGDVGVPEEGYDDERGMEHVREVMESDEPVEFEWKVEDADGQTHTMDVRGTAARIGGEERYLAIGRNVTERKRRERAIETLQVATERLQTAETPAEVATIAVETASDVLELPMAVCWFHDADREHLEPVAATERAREAELISGLSTDRYEYDVFLDGAVTEYTPSEEGANNPLETGVLLPLGDHGLIAAGSRDGGRADATVLEVAQALADHATTALERVEQAEAVRESERRFRLIAERIEEVIYLAEPDLSEALYVNPAYETVWGRPVDELYDDARQFLNAVDPRDREAVVADFETMVEEIIQGEPSDSYDFEYRIRRPDGEVRWINATGYAAEVSAGTRRFVGIVEDITERKLREQRLEVFNRILRHNLRNQLDVIRSHAETLSARSEDDGSHADRIVTAVDELAAMGARARKTDQIMSMEAEVSDVSVPKTLREAVEAVAPTHSDVDVTTKLPATAQLSTNRDALYAAVTSALENAIEHADSEVIVAVEDQSDGYTVVIEDDGPGIPEEELMPIKTGTETNLQHGRGLGLWQLRWGVDKLNGELSFNTEDGTTIRIRVPDHSETAD